MPITIIEPDGVCNIRAGGKLASVATSIVWLAEPGRRARGQHCSQARWPGSGRSTAATAAVARSAGSLGATLKPDDMVIALGRGATQPNDRAMCENMVIAALV